MPRLSLVHSFLDRFEQRLEVDCERLKRQLLAQVDQQFGVLKTKVRKLRIRFFGDRPGTVNIDSWIDDPPVETVPLELCIREQPEQDAALANQPSNFTARKRKSSSTSRSVNNNKRQKTGTSDGCGKSFPTDFLLANHERIHLKIKPFACTWHDCRYSAVKKGDVVIHVRVMHFKLPRLLKEQERVNIVDNRNPEDYIRVDAELLERRIE